MSGFRQNYGIKHLAFFEVIASEPDHSERSLAAKAGLLVLRLMDHWILTGPAIVQPESKNVLSARAAIVALQEQDATRRILISIVNAMQTCHNVDIAAILPRVAAYGMLLRREAWAKRDRKSVV